MAPISRRDVLRVAAAASLTPLLPGCANGDSTATSGSNTVRFDHGVASGDPRPDAVMLWTRITPAASFAGPISVDWRIARDAALRDIIAHGSVQTGAASDYTVKVDARGLQPGQTWYYAFEAGGVASPTGRTRTAAIGALANLRLAFVTCSNYGRGYFNVYGRVAARDDLQAVVHLGDYIYEGGAQDGVRPETPAHELLSLADYRQRYATLRTDPDLQALHARHPMIWVWDDHEVANNSWKDGAEAHDPATEGPYAVRRANAFQAAHEWLPIRAPYPDDRSRIYRHFAFGDLVDLIMIDARNVGRDAPVAPDSRFGRSVPAFRQTGAFADPARHILGDTQEQWFAQQLAASTARWRIIGNQVIFSPLKLIGAPRATNLSLFLSNDKWDGYEPARDRALEPIRAARNVVVLTGDAHEAYAFDITPDPNNPLAYDPLTGQGALGVEFVVTSTTTRGDDPVGHSLSRPLTRAGEDAQQLLRLTNPHLKYFENRFNGYVLIDVTPARTQAEFWFVPSIGTRSEQEMLEATFICLDGSARLQRSG